MLKLKSVKTDLKAEREGDWVPYPAWPGVKFKVKSLYSPEFQRERGLLLRKLAKKYGDDPVPADEMTQEMGTLYADHILLGWEEIDEAYSPEQASKMLPDPEWRLLYAAVQYCADRVGTSEAEFIRADAKN